MRKGCGPLGYLVDYSVIGAPEHGQHALEFHRMPVWLPVLRTLRTRDARRPHTVGLQPSERDTRIAFRCLATVKRGIKPTLLNRVISHAPRTSGELLYWRKRVRPLRDRPRH